MEKRGIGIIETRQISRHAGTNILHAFDYAKFIEKPLNIYIVINFDEADAEKAATYIFKSLRERYRAWLRYAANKFGLDKMSPAYVATFENPEGKNPHVNWVVHVPENLIEEFLKKLPMWVHKSQGHLRPRDICAQMVDPYTDKSLAKYIIKGTDKHFEKYFHLEKYAADQDQGVVAGRRTVVSPEIGTTARRKAAFLPAYHRHRWKKGGVAPRSPFLRSLLVNKNDPKKLEKLTTGMKAGWGGLELPLFE